MTKLLNYKEDEYIRFKKINGNCEDFKVLGKYKIIYVSSDKIFVSSARNKMITVYNPSRRGDFNMEEDFFFDDFEKIA